MKGSTFWFSCLVFWVGVTLNEDNMAGYVEIDEKKLELDEAELDVFHCDAPEADWRLKLQADGETYMLSGTAEPSPRKRDDLVISGLRVAPRDLDDVLSVPLGHNITAWVDTKDGAAHFKVRQHEDGLYLETEFEFDWDRHHDPKGVEYDTPRSARLEVWVGETRFHDGDLPKDGA